MKQLSTKWYVKKFIFMSDALSFQRKKRAEGWRTVRNTIAGTGWPYTEIKWQERSTPC